MKPAEAKITAFATQGSCGAQVLDDELRLRTLLERFPARYLPFDRKKKLESFLGVVKALARERPDLVVMEGTGIGGGAAVLAARALFRTRYVLSSGDAVAPFVRSASAWEPPLGVRLRIVRFSIVVSELSAASTGLSDDDPLRLLLFA